MVSQKYLDKAEVLIEALPYIQRFHGKIIVVKYGGSAMLDEDLKRQVIEDVVLLKLVGFQPIIVHGGGKEISSWSERLGLETNFVSGLRVTDEKALEVAEMVLAKVNKELVSMVNTLGVKAVGISGKDGGLLQVKKKYVDGEDIGFVGDVHKVDPKIIFDLLEKGFLPIIYPIGIGKKGQGYNINGDEAACAVAKAVKAEKLAYLTDTDGVYQDRNDPETLIAELYVNDAEAFMESGEICGGMLPKIKNCVSAIRKGVHRVHVLDGRIPHSLLLEIFTNKGIGTAIMAEKEQRYYLEEE